MFGTYDPNDVTILLKDITGMVMPLDNRTRERLIQQGVHYSEMLPLEYKPSKEYLDTYERALAQSAKETARAVGCVSDKLWRDSGKNTVLVSLARAGTSAGVLIKRFIRLKYGCDLPHYTVSIIRGKGIDKNAVNYILERHGRGGIRFVDGWTGKGAIQNQLDEAMEDFPGICPGLSVLTDPAGVALHCGTREDIFIASSCLNSVVSGLLSRTFFREDIIGENDFHGAAFYSELAGDDLTYQFIDAVEKSFDISDISYESGETAADSCGMDEVRKIYRDFGMSDVNFIKPGIGEATRVLLRRIPWKILVHSLDDYEHLGHLYILAKEKNADIEIYPLERYRACGLIKKLADV